MEFPNHGWWPTTGQEWPTSITLGQFGEFLATIAPTPEDRAQIAERLGIEPWSYSSRSDLWDCIRAWIFRRELGWSEDDIRVCRRDGEPLVWTFEFPGAEWYCVVCGGHEDLFGNRAPSTPELMRRLDELTEQYERGRAERQGGVYSQPPKVGDDGVEAPTCSGCGATPEVGIALHGEDRKPKAWFSRTLDGVTSYACSRACIPEGEGVMPW